MKSVCQLQTQFLPVLGVPLLVASPNLLPIQNGIWNYLNLVRAMLLSLKSEECPLASLQTLSLALTHSPLISNLSCQQGVLTHCATSNSCLTVCVALLPWGTHP